MVVTFLPCVWDRLIWHERTALPSICSVQAPHSPEPHPDLVPVSFRCSRTTHSSGVPGSASTLTDLPLTTNAIEAIGSSPEYCFCSLGPHLAFGLILHSAKWTARATARSATRARFGLRLSAAA